MSPNLRRIQQYVIDVHTSSCELPPILIRFLVKLQFSTHISNKYVKFQRQSALWVTELFRADGRNEMTTPTVSFRNFSNAPKNKLRIPMAHTVCQPDCDNFTERSNTPLQSVVPPSLLCRQRPVLLSRRLGSSLDHRTVWIRKNQLYVTFCILYFSSNCCSTRFGQPCAHHQELTTA